MKRGSFFTKINIMFYHYKKKINPVDKNAHLYCTIRFKCVILKLFPYISQGNKKTWSSGAFQSRNFFKHESLNKSVSISCR